MPVPIDRLMRVRLRRQLMGVLTWFMFALPLLYAIHHGWMEIGYVGLAGFALASILVNAIAYWLIRSGRTAHLSDPALTFWQVAAAATSALVMSYYANEARVIPLMLFFTGFFFGVFSFSKRQYLVLTAYVAIGYAAMLLFKHSGRTVDVGQLRIEWLYYAVLVLTLFWMSLLGAYVSGLRSKLALKRNELSQALERLQQLASHDDLTGAFNRRHLLELLEQQRERAERFGEVFSIAILDLDHFKRLNDRHGHQVGDEALTGFCERMRQHARRIDVIGRSQAGNTFGRYGGEEFLLLLPYARLDGAAQGVERLRRAVTTEPFPSSAGPLRLAFSAGVAEYRREETAAQLLVRADAALYRAKTIGRNRVELAV